MKKLIKFPSIEQFRTVITNINRHYNFVGLNENGEAIYDLNKPKPVITFKGTVKLHGTNAAVCYNNVSGLWAQSRENIITPLNDNAGFAFFVETKKDAFIRLMKLVAEKNNLDLNSNTISIYGEWAGSGIQKTVAISGIDKSLFIFGVKITPFNNESDEQKEVAYWVDYSYLKDEESRIYNIDDYETYSINIDFNEPQLFQNKLIEITMDIEKECPVGKKFGIIGVGEGCVWTANVNGNVYRFKVKGDAHAGKSKVKTLKPVDDEKIKKLIEISEKVTPVWRLSQMIEKSCNLSNGGELDRRNLGAYIKLVIDDIVKEDIDILIDNNVEIKDITKYVSEIAKNYFFEQEKV